MKKIAFLCIGVTFSLAACHSSSENQTSPDASHSLPTQQSLSRTKTHDEDLRFITVHDSDFRGFSFDVFMDGVQLGTTPADEEARWGKSLAPGSHELTVSALSGAASKSTEVWVSLYSGTLRPLSFVEPQANGARCQFMYSTVDFDEELVGLGKQQAACRIREGERLSLLVHVSEPGATRRKHSSQER